MQYECWPIISVEDMCFSAGRASQCGNEASAGDAASGECNFTAGPLLCGCGGGEAKERRVGRCMPPNYHPQFAFSSAKKHAIIISKGLAAESGSRRHSTASIWAINARWRHFSGLPGLAASRCIVHAWGRWASLEEKRTNCRVPSTSHSPSLAEGQNGFEWYSLFHFVPCSLKLLSLSCEAHNAVQ